MEGVSQYTCAYRLDGLQCEHPYGHFGDHLVTVVDREVKWVYGDSERTEDLVRGYPACDQTIIDEADDKIRYCHLVVDHEGNHVSAEGFTFSDEDVEHWLSGDDPTEAAPTPVTATPPTSPVVEAALRAREDQEPSLIAVTRLGGGVDRFEVIGWHVHEGALYVITHEDDIVYAAGQWVGVRAQARS